MSDEHDPTVKEPGDAAEVAASTAEAAIADPATTASTAAEPATATGVEGDAQPRSESIAAAAGVDTGAAVEAGPTIEADAATAVPTLPEPADAAATVATIRPARRRALAAASAVGRLLRFAFVLALFVGGAALGYQAHLSMSTGSNGPVADPATAGNQPAPVIRELIAAVASNDADRIRAVIPAEPYKLFTSEMESWSFQEVNSVETLATFEDGTRTATAFVMIGRSSQGNPVTINLVVETDGGNIVDFK